MSRQRRAREHSGGDNLGKQRRKRGNPWLDVIVSKLADERDDGVRRPRYDEQSDQD